MFTVEQIKQAHSKVKSGADFPAYIRELESLGVSNYETYVSDGHTDYRGADNYKTAAPAKYAALNVAETANAAQFKADLKAHQQGASSYPEFCKQAAQGGVEKWIVDIDRMTCTYYDLLGNEILQEHIPG